MMSSGIGTSRANLPLILRAIICTVLAVLVATAAHRLDFRQPFIGYGFGGAFLLFLAVKPSRIRIAIVSILGLAIAASVIWGHYDSIPTLLVQGMGALGLASLLLLGCAVTWNGRETESAAYRALLPGAVLTFLILGAVYSLNMASLLKPTTYDLYAYAFDGSLGFQPSFVVAHFLNQTPWLFPFVKVSYEGIVLAMAAIYAAFMLRREKPVWEVIEFLFAPAMIGYLFFSVFPVCGPRYAFAMDFPNAYLPYSVLHRLALESVPVLTAFPRNGVPSLHMTWALMIWLNSRGLSRSMRTVALLLVFATGFDTLATGEHYLFDLVVSLPFVLWMQASLVRSISFRQRERWLPALVGCIMFLAWLAIGRFAVHALLSSPLLSWSLVLVSSSISIAWSVRLPAMIPEVEIPSKAQAFAAVAQ